MAEKRGWGILLLVTMSLAGIGLGIWLFRAGEVLLGCVYIGLWLWTAQRFAMWLLIPAAVPADGIHGISSRWQRVFLGIACLLGAGICAMGVYFWFISPDDWQAGLVIILLGLVVLAPVTATEVRYRRRLRASR